jgi:hypothetical protein
MVMNKVVPVLILIILFAVAGWLFFTQEPDAVHELPPPTVPPAVTSQAPLPELPPAVTEAPSDSAAEPVEMLPPLPVLNESDEAIEQALSEVADSGRLEDYLVKDQVVSRAVVAIDALTSRQVPGLVNPVKPAGDKFIVGNLGDKVVMSAENFTRYDGYVALLESMDSDELLGFYRRYYPLFQQAWEENGGEGSFNDRAVEVIDNLLETPDISGPVYLVKPEAFYLFEDPELEAMTAGQKILVRMGSSNAATVKQKLRELRARLAP